MRTMKVPGGRVNGLRFGPDGRELVVWQRQGRGAAEDEVTYRRCGTDGTVMPGSFTTSAVSAVAPDSPLLAHQGPDLPGKLELTGLGGAAAGRQVLPAGGWHSSALAFAPDGRWLWTAFASFRYNARWRGGVRRFDLPGGEVGETIPAPARATCLAVSPDGRFLAASFGRPTRLGVYDRESKCWAEWDYPASVTRLAFAPRAPILAAVGLEGATLWELPAKKSPARLLWRDEAVNDLAFSPDGRAFAVAGQDGSVRVRDADAHAQRQVYWWQIGRVGAVAFAPDGLMLAAGGEDGQVIVWDADGP